MKIAGLNSTTLSEQIGELAEDVENKADINHTHGWANLTNNADSIEEGTSDVTDNTEILTSYASNNGFNDPNGKGKVYRRDAIRLFNYIKNKLSLGSEIDVTNLFNGANVTGLSIGEDFFTKNKFYYKPTVSGIRQPLQVNVYQENSSWKVSFHFLEPEGFVHDTINIYYAVATVDAPNNRLVHEAHDNFQK